MNNNDFNGKKTKWFRVGTTCTVIAVFMLLAYIGLCHKYHFYWKYIEWQHDLRQINAIPNRPVPEIDIPPDWTVHTWKCLSFSMPPDTYVLTEVDNGNIIVYSCSELNMIITHSPLMPEIKEFLAVSSQMVLTRNRTMTLPEIKSEFSKRGACDFRYSMRPEEVRSHIYAMTTRSSLYIDNAKFAETLSKNNWEGVLFFEENHVGMDWQCVEGKNMGYVTFKAPDGQILDHDVIRRISQSMKIKCEEQR